MPDTGIEIVELLRDGRSDGIWLKRLAGVLVNIFRLEVNIGSGDLHFSTLNARDR